MPQRSHGQANNRISGYKSRAYGIWQAMKDRCSNKNRGDWHCYGGKGIEVCESWRNDFAAFLADMGEPPEGLTLDRKDSDKGYYKDNCRWATRQTQARNSKNALAIEISGEVKTLSEWLAVSGTKRPTYYRRKYAGWPTKDCIFGRS